MCGRLTKPGDDARAAGVRERFISTMVPSGVALDSAGVKEAASACGLEITDAEAACASADLAAVLSGGASTCAKPAAARDPWAPIDLKVEVRQYEDALVAFFSAHRDKLSVAHYDRWLRGMSVAALVERFGDAISRPDMRAKLLAERPQEVVECPAVANAMSADEWRAAIAAGVRVPVDRVLSGSIRPPAIAPIVDALAGSCMAAPGDLRRLGAFIRFAGVDAARKFEGEYLPRALAGDGGSASALYALSMIGSRDRRAFEAAAMYLPYHLNRDPRLRAAALSFLQHAGLPRDAALAGRMVEALEMIVRRDPDGELRSRAGAVLLSAGVLRVLDDPRKNADAEIDPGRRGKR